jgi:hypothetical protein
VQSVQVIGGASVNSQQILLPNAGVPVFVMSFVLQRDRDNGADVKIVLYFFTATAATCQVRVAPGQMIRK